MGTVAVWRGGAGSGKTRRALEVLRQALATGRQDVRYLVPTVGHKRSIEGLLLAGACHGLLGDPVTTFFNFAEEVAARARLRGRSLSEMQKYLLLKRQVRETTAEAYAGVKRYPGFLVALREAIDELKVHMIQPDVVQAAAGSARDRGYDGLADKLEDLGQLYAEFQAQMKVRDLYDSEGLMWIAARELDKNHRLFSDLNCLILDGFARLTPIQIDFIRSLSACVPRIIVLLDSDDGRAPGTFHPVEESIADLKALRGVTVEEETFSAPPRPAQMLAHLQQQLFRTRPDRWAREPDASLQLFVGATPAHEAEMIAREIHALLRQRKLPDGDAIGPADIAILARGAASVAERFTPVLARYGIPLRTQPPLLAQTAVGRALLAAFTLVREGWGRERVIPLLKFGFLDLPRDTACRVEMQARTTFLPEEREAWMAEWPHDDTREALAAALAPLLAFDEAYRHGGAQELLAGVRALLRAFQAQTDARPLAFPDADPAAAQGRVRERDAFAAAESLLQELQGLGNLIGGFRGEEVLDVITTALVQEAVDDAAPAGEGVSILSAHATGGEKFKVVFLCDLREGSFPRHLRESAFLLDDEREQRIPGLEILDPRRHMEEDERYWFLHAVCSASRRLILSYPAHASDGGSLERSTFLADVEQAVPQLKVPKEALARGSAFQAPCLRVTALRDLTPPLLAAESEREYLAALVHRLTTEPLDDRPSAVAAACAAWPGAPGAEGRLPAIFRIANPGEGALADATADRVAARQHSFSATELQAYADCPFIWFVGYGLHLREIEEEYGALERGTVLHAVLCALYADLPAPLRDCMVEELMARAEPLLRAELEAAAHFQAMPAFLRDVELEALRRGLERFLAAEIARAQARRTHPVRGEWSFYGPVPLAGVPVPLRGKIDRVDLADDDLTRAVIVDYKTSLSSYTGAKLLRGEFLQAPLYALAARALLDLDIIAAEYLGLIKGEAVGIGGDALAAVYDDTEGLKVLKPGEWEAYLDEQAARILGFVQAIRRGAIPRNPATDRCPDRCWCWPICRGDYVTLKERYYRNKGR
jgi:ATP-dependent helicase/DNAse subunit B